jgi:hypothetical protein
MVDYEANSAAFGPVLALNLPDWAAIGPKSDAMRPYNDFHSFPIHGSRSREKPKNAQQVRYAATPSFWGPENVVNRSKGGYMGAHVAVRAAFTYVDGGLVKK